MQQNIPSVIVFATHILKRKSKINTGHHLPVCHSKPRARKSHKNHSQQFRPYHRWNRTKITRYCTVSDPHSLMRMRNLEEPEQTDPTHSHKMSIFIFFFLLFYKFNRKGTVPRNFWLQVFSWISFPQVPEYTIRLFQICSKIHGDIRNSRFTTGVRHRWQIKKSSIRKFFTPDPGSRGKKGTGSRIADPQHWWKPVLRIHDILVWIRIWRINASD